MLAGCVAYPKFSRPAKDTVLRKFAKAALDAGTDVMLSRKAAQAAARMISFVPEVATADPLWYPPDGLSLYQ